jgi:hypothetical protein
MRTFRTIAIAIVAMAAGMTSPTALAQTEAKKGPVLVKQSKKLTSASHSNQNEPCPAIGRGLTFSYEYTGSGNNIDARVYLNREDVAPLAPGTGLVIENVDFQQNRGNGWDENPNQHPETLGPQQSGQYDRGGFISASRTAHSYYEPQAANRVRIRYSHGFPYPAEYVDVVLRPPAARDHAEYGDTIGFYRSTSMCMDWFNARRTEIRVHVMSTESSGGAAANPPEILSLRTYFVKRGSTHAKRIRLRRSCHSSSSDESSPNFADDSLECRLRGVPKKLKGWIQVVTKSRTADGTVTITQMIRR